MKAIFLCLLMVLSSLSGCFGNEEISEEEIESDLWNFEIGERTWYHFANATAVEDVADFKYGGRNIPFEAEATYYGIGMTTFEPTMGITQTDTLVMSSYGNGPAGSNVVVSCGLIGMTDLAIICEKVYDPSASFPNSTDP